MAKNKTIASGRELPGVNVLLDRPEPEKPAAKPKPKPRPKAKAKAGA